MSRDSYAVIRPDGTTLRVGTVIPTELEDGQRISYRSDHINAPDHHEPILIYELGDCRGEAKHYVDPWYIIEVVGSDPDTVMKVIRELQLVLGGKEVGLHIPILPALGSVWRRIRFLLWDYPIRGRITAQ